MALSLALPAVVGPEALAQTANAASRPWMLIVSGASGEARFAAEFTALGSAFRDAAVQRFGIPDSMAIWLAEDPTRDPTRIRGRSTRATIDTTLACGACTRVSSVAAAPARTGEALTTVQPML